MNIEQLQQLIERYGGNAILWPEDEREAALTLINKSDAARQLLVEAAQLDALLNSYHIPEDPAGRQRMMRRILDQVTPGWPERLLAWLTPDPGRLNRSIWRPALAAALPLVIGMTLGAAQSGALVSNTVPEVVSTDSSTAWDEELHLLGLTPRTNHIEEWLNE